MKPLASRFFALTLALLALPALPGVLAAPLLDAGTSCTAQAATDPAAQSDCYLSALALPGGPTQTLLDNNGAACGAWVRSNDSGTPPEAACGTVQVVYGTPECGTTDGAYACTFSITDVLTNSGDGCFRISDNANTVGWTDCGVGADRTTFDKVGTIANVPPGGEDFAFTSTYCVAYSRALARDESMQSCRTWTVGILHFPGPS